MQNATLSDLVNHGPYAGSHELSRFLPSAGGNHARTEDLVWFRESGRGVESTPPPLVQINMNKSICTKESTKGLRTGWNPPSPRLTKPHFSPSVVDRRQEWGIQEGLGINRNEIFSRRDIFMLKSQQFFGRGVGPLPVRKLLTEEEIRQQQHAKLESDVKGYILVTY